MLKNLAKKYQTVAFVFCLALVLAVLSAAVTITFVQVFPLVGFSPMGAIAIILIDAVLIGYTAHVIFGARHIKRNEE